jgi:hypothetical protein
VADGTYNGLGWPASAYRISKMALNVLTEVLSREQRHDPRRRLINAAMLPPDGPSGGFFRDRALASW